MVPSRVKKHISKILSTTWIPYDLFVIEDACYEYYKLFTGLALICHNMLVLLLCQIKRMYYFFCWHRRYHNYILFKLLIKRKFHVCNLENKRKLTNVSISRRHIKANLFDVQQVSNYTRVLSMDHS